MWEQEIKKDSTVDWDEEEGRARLMEMVGILLYFMENERDQTSGITKTSIDKRIGALLPPR